MIKLKCKIIEAGEPKTDQDGSWICLAKVEPKDWTIFESFLIAATNTELPRPPKVGEVVWVQPATVLGFVEEGGEG